MLNIDVRLVELSSKLRLKQNTANKVKQVKVCGFIFVFHHILQSETTFVSLVASQDVVVLPRRSKVNSYGKQC